MVSEKVGGAEGTKLDEDFKELEKVTYIYMFFKKISILNMKNNNILFYWKLNDITQVFLTSSKLFVCTLIYIIVSLSNQRADVTSKAVVEVINKTSEYLQPNPATRAKLSMLNTVSKIRGQVKSPGYPQPEGLLGECMTKYGRDMGEDNNFGKSSGES